MGTTNPLQPFEILPSGYIIHSTYFVGDMAVFKHVNIPQLDGVACESEERLLIVGATNRPQEIDEAARFVPLVFSHLKLILHMNTMTGHE